VLELPAAGEPAQGAVRIDVPAALALARGLLPVMADGAFRDEAARSADAFFARAYPPDTQAALRNQMPDAAELRKFLAVQRSKFAAKALEEIARSAAWKQELEELTAALDRVAGATSLLGRVELDARYVAGGVELELRATAR